MWRNPKPGVAKADADLQRTRDLYANRAAAQKEVLAAETVTRTVSSGLDTRAGGAGRGAQTAGSSWGLTKGSVINSACHDPILCEWQSN